MFYGTLRVVVALLIIVGVALSFLPLVETNVWWVRYADFIRVQLVVVLGICVPALLMLGGAKNAVGVALALLAVGGLGYHGYRLHPYFGTAGEMAIAAGSCTDEDRLRVMVANVQKSNEHRVRFLDVATQAEPDLLLLLETDAWWNEAIEPLTERYPFVVEHIPEEDQAFGMHLLSRLPLVEPEVVFWFGAETPTIRADVVLPSDEVVAFTGLHPRPPLAWDQPTTMRDAHLLQAALASAGSEEASIVAGDFNAVPWERISWHAMRIGGLLDPRVGRGLYPSYNAQSWIVSWPLDQVLYQEQFGLLAFERLPNFGSDHYPVVADLCLAPDFADSQSAPAIEAGDLAEADTAIRAAEEVR